MMQHVERIFLQIPMRQQRYCIRIFDESWRARCSSLSFYFVPRNAPPLIPLTYRLANQYMHIIGTLR